MKKHLIVIGIIVLLLAVGLSGCEEFLDIELPKDEYITVTVKAAAQFVYEVSEDMANIELAGVPGMEIKITMDKAGGEYKDFYGTTDENGDTKTYSHTFKLYREQPINIYANLYSDVPDFLKNYSISSDSMRITWDEIHAKADFGESVTIGTYGLRIYGDKPDDY